MGFGKDTTKSDCSMEKIVDLDMEMSTQVIQHRPVYRLSLLYMWLVFRIGQEMHTYPGTSNFTQPESIFCFMSFYLCLIWVVIIWWSKKWQYWKNAVVEPHLFTVNISACSKKPHPKMVYQRYSSHERDVTLWLSNTESNSSGITKPSRFNTARINNLKWHYWHVLILTPQL